MFRSHIRTPWQVHQGSDCQRTHLICRIHAIAQTPLVHITHSAFFLFLALSHLFYRRLNVVYNLIKHIITTHVLT